MTTELQLFNQQISEIGRSLLQAMFNLGLKRETKHGPWPVLFSNVLTLKDQMAVFVVDAKRLPVSIGDIDRADVKRTLAAASGYSVASTEGFTVRDPSGRNWRFGYSLVVRLRPSHDSRLPTRVPFSLNDMPAGDLMLFFGQGMAGPLWIPLHNLVHVLLTGTSGSGKSSLYRALIASLVLRSTTDELRLVLIDGKRTEYAFWSNAPHLIDDVAFNLNGATNAIVNLQREVERRLALFVKSAVLDLDGYNRLHPDRPLPRIACFVDELLMFALKSGRRSWFYTTLIDVAGRARGAGVHLFVATTSPQAEWMDSALRNNLETKISGYADNGSSMATFRSNAAASLPIIRGRMIGKLPGTHGLTIFQSPFIGEDELRAISSGVGESTPAVAEFEHIELSPDERAVLDVLLTPKPEGTAGHYTDREMFSLVRGRVSWHRLIAIGQAWANGHLWLAPDPMGGRRVTRKLFDDLQIADRHLVSTDVSPNVS